MLDEIIKAVINRVFDTAVIVSPHGMRGRLTGFCPGDLVKQLYFRWSQLNYQEIILTFIVDTFIITTLTEYVFFVNMVTVLGSQRLQMEL